MVQRAPLFLTLLSAALVSAVPVVAGAQTIFDGRVSNSPVPAAKGPGEPAADGTFEQSPLPSVLRPGEGDDAPLTTDDDAPLATDDDTRDPSANDEDDGSGRFVRAPVTTPDVSDPVRDGDPGAPIAPPSTELQKGARLRQLDKMTGSIVTFDIGVGQTMEVQRIRVQLDACRSPSDNDTHGTMAFLNIWDKKNPDDDAIFTGWMFAESPALSALDHPRYDLWVISCTIISGAVSAGNE